MREDTNYEQRVLNTKETIEALIFKELKVSIYNEGTPYIKFLFFPIIIEYLGACLDSFPFNEDGHSENRFNDALKKLFLNKYKTFSKSDSQYYIYEGFRCNMVHRLMPKGFTLTTRKEAIEDGNSHLKLDCFRQEKICLVLEDFYDDIEKAAKKLIRMYDDGRAPKQKSEEVQLRITSKK